mgnify:CR=1 FL=1
MDRSTELALVRRIFDYLDTRTTAMTDRVHLEPAVGYDSRAGKPASSAGACSSTSPGPGAARATSRNRENFVSHDLTGVPIALVRARSRPRARVPERLSTSRREGRPADPAAAGTASRCPYHAWTYD